MYISKHFEPPNGAALHELIRDYPLATVVINTTAGLSANHLPLRLVQADSGNGVLQGHVARANPMWRECTDNAVLAIFQGPEAYVSPNWYPTKQEHGKVVPTWNYAAVHAEGEIRFIDDPGWKLDLVRTLTREHEADQPKPWQVSDAPEDYIGKLLDAIVGLEIEIRALHGKWKLSQNQPAQNRAGVASGLAERSDSNARLVARLMAEFAKAGR